MENKTDKIKKELESNYAKQLDKKIAFANNDILDLSNRSLAELYFNSIYTEYPSMYTSNDVYYTNEIIEFLKTDSVLLFRSVNDTHIFYVFDYKQMIITCTDNLQYENKVLLKFYFHTRNCRVNLDFWDRYRSPETTNAISILKKNAFNEISVEKIDLNVKTEFNPELNYNDDFIHFKEKIVNTLSQKTSGLILLHGIPGSGKSVFCKHLLKLIDRNFIFIPPNMVGGLSSPEFAEILTGSHKGSVLIIEDAEKALMKRESDDGFNNSELVSSILNLTDGIFADLTNVSIIATYNCDRNLIDPALLRKGRLKCEYEFKKLTIEKTQKLLDHLNIKHTATEEMSVADIYNFEEENTNVDRETKRIGFC